MKLKNWLLSLAVAFNGIAFGQTRVEPEKNEPKLVDRFTLVFETGTYHFGGGYNDFNPGVGFEYRINRTFHTGVGIYYNSLRKPSVYALVGAEAWSHRFFGVGIEVGGITGYNWPVVPAAMPYVRFGSREGRINLKVDALPPFPGMTPALITFQVRVKLGETGKPLLRKQEKKASPKML